jgi:hypothetical protein
MLTPFEVGAHSVHLPLIHGNAAVADERVLSVVQLRHSVTVRVVSNLVI